MSNTDKMSVRDFVQKATKDRYALIINEDDVPFARANADKIYQLYPCTGILVRCQSEGFAYHITRASTEDIQRNGLLPSSNSETTYGSGVIYAFPEICCFQRVDPEKWTLYQLHYDAGCLQALITYDKDDNEQHEVLIFPDKLLSTTQIEIPPELRK